MRDDNFSQSHITAHTGTGTIGRAGTHTVLMGLYGAAAGGAGTGLHTVRSVGTANSHLHGLGGAMGHGALGTGTGTGGDGSLFEITHNPDFNILHYASVSHFPHSTLSAGAGGLAGVGTGTAKRPARGGLLSGKQPANKKEAAAAVAAAQAKGNRQHQIASLLQVLVMSTHDLDASPIKHFFDTTLLRRLRGIVSDAN